MKGDPEVVGALNACLKYERTAEDCAAQYQVNFHSWGQHGLGDDFASLRRHAKKRRVRLMKRLNLLDSIPSNDRYPIDVIQVQKPDDIVKVNTYFRTMYEETRATYEKGRGLAKDVGDSVSHKIMGANKAKVEKDLARMEGKARRIGIIGPATYLAHHMHRGGGPGG